MATASAARAVPVSGASVAARVPASFFSMVMGLAALAAAWRAAARTYSVSPWLATALLALAAALWAALALAQVVRAVTARDALLAELRDPVEGSLAAFAPASLLLLAAGIQVLQHETAVVLFWIGFAAQLALGVWIVGRWFIAAVDPAHVTPAMYLPAVVGNLVAAQAAGTLGLGDLGRLLFGAGVVAWLVIFAVLLGRHLSAGELPKDVRPLLGLELAPPALALVAWQSLEGNGADPTSRALLGWSIFVALVLLRLLGRLREVPFSASYWAFAFPVAALSAATLRVAQAAPGSFAAALALPLLVVASGVLAVIVFRTATAIARGELLPRE